MRRNSNILNDKLAASLPAPEKGYQLYFDTQVPGFGVRVTATGARAYILNYRANGVERRMTIGSVQEWQCTTARAEAKRLKKEVYYGSDPLGEKQERRAQPTMGDLVDRFEREYFPRLRPASIKPYQNATRRIRAAWRHKPVVELTPSDVDAFHNGLSRATPVLANLVLSVLSRTLALAVRWGWTPTNVAKGVERNAETNRERYLTPAEIERLSQVLASWPDRRVANVVRLLMLTGARKGEVLSMRWEHIDAEAGVWTKPASLTKQKKVHRVPLSAAAMAVLSTIDRTSEYVFPSHKGKPLATIQGPWADICKAAGLVDFRCHDLRHTYASVLVQAGLSLAIVGKLLGHSSPQITQRYAHLSDSPLRAATERASGLLKG